ncbi:MAG TPA: T9SS type A sorting domain-containing protein, partial [Ferruginibacter sp.]|nr:T9SS type A sorting domain-containing protein [Ferruginibacter sp.]
TNATILTSNTGVNTLSFSHTTSIYTSNYYFAKITQVDGDIIWTAPIWVYRDAVVLPIVLLKFAGVQHDANINLNWQTLTETNVNYFEVEHSADGEHFKKIGIVSSKFHNSDLPTNYYMQHDAPVNGLNFYRLKQFDMDGKFIYSDIIAVQFNYSMVQKIKINPNPVFNTLNMEMSVLENSNLHIKIYNTSGREVKSFIATVSIGKNNLSTDVSNLPNGTYIMVIINKNERVAETKFVKQ